MNYSKFTEDYRRWRWVPRSSNEAFRDANYAASIEVFAPRKSGFFEAAFHIAVWCAAAVGFSTVIFNIMRALV